MTKTSDLIGKKIMHGSPGYLLEETIAKITPLDDRIEIEFESGWFTQMTHEEYAHLLRHEELAYREMTHGGMSKIYLNNFFDW